MATRKSGMKLSGLLRSGAIPQADPAVVARMPALAAPEPQTLERQEIPVALIDPSPFQPRLRFDTDDLGRLAESIQEGSLSEPISVRASANGRYELISGERRWRAHQSLGLETIPATVQTLDDRQAALLTIASNTVREDLSDFELGRCFQKILDEGHTKSVAQLGKLIGMSRQQIDRCLDFMKLPSDIISRLEQRPDYFGANCAEFFAGYVKKGHGEAVSEAARLIAEEGYTEQKAMAWLKNAVAPESLKRRKTPANVPLFAGEKPLGSARIERRKLVIDCHEGVKPGELLETIRSLLKESPT
jgi:ParB family chromosome partitioning protein